jgi:hypothetical protein
LDDANRLNSDPQLFGNEGIEALPRQHRREMNLAMQVGWDSGHKLAGKWLVRSFTALLAECQVVVNRIAERLGQFNDAVALKRDDVWSVDDFPVKDLCLVVEFDFPS